MTADLEIATNRNGVIVSMYESTLITDYGRSDKFIEKIHNITIEKMEKKVSPFF